MEDSLLFSITAEEVQKIARRFLERELSREELQHIARWLRNEYERRGITPEDLVVAVIEAGMRHRE